MELKQNGMEQKIRCSLPESWKAGHREEKLRVLCCLRVLRPSKDIVPQWRREGSGLKHRHCPFIAGWSSLPGDSPERPLGVRCMAVSSEDLHRFIMKFTSYTYLSCFFSRHNTIFTNTAYSFLINSDLSQDSIFLSAWASSHPCVSSWWRCIFQRLAFVFLPRFPLHLLLLSFQFK